MSKEKFADIVRRGYHGFNTADGALLTQIFDANATWETPGKSPIAGLRKGHSVLRRTQSCAWRAAAWWR